MRMYITREQLLECSNEEIQYILINTEPGLSEYINNFLYGFVNEPCIDIPEDVLPDSLKQLL